MHQNQAQAQNIAFASTAGNAPRERGGLEVASDAMHKAITVADSALDALESRLQPVMRPPVPVPNATSVGQLAAVQVVSHAVDTLNNQRARVEMLSLRLQNLIERLDT